MQATNNDADRELRKTLRKMRRLIYSMDRRLHNLNRPNDAPARKPKPRRDPPMTAWELP